MYILKNAYLSIIRNKGRNILIGIIILVIACACSVTLAIKNSASTLIKSYENQYQVTATLDVNRESLMQNSKNSSQGSNNNKKQMIENFNDIGSLSISDIENYASSEYVKSYYYTNSIGLNGLNIETASKTIPDENNNNSSKSQNDNQKPNNMPNDNPNTNSYDFTVIGYSSYEAMEDFISGNYTISSGEVSSDFNSNTCVINSELASLNNLNVSDTITLVDPNDESKTYTLTITGIFTENNSSSDNKMDMFSKSANTIITNVNVINNIINSDTNIKQNLNPTFILKSKDVVDNFKNELTNKGLNQYLTLKTNLDSIENATSSISNLSSFANIFLIITLVIGAIILFILNMINVRERKYEIGVLRTIGMKKSALILQFTSELLIVTIIFLMLGTSIGAIISVPTANKLLEREINSSNSQKENVNNNFGGNMMEKGMSKPNDKINGIADVEKIDSINAVVDFKVLLELLGIGILLTLISSSAATFSIQRFSPLTILKERS